MRGHRSIDRCQVRRSHLACVPKRPADRSDSPDDEAQCRAASRHGGAGRVNEPSHHGSDRHALRPHALRCRCGARRVCAPVSALRRCTGESPPSPARSRGELRSDLVPLPLRRDLVRLARAAPAGPRRCGRHCSACLSLSPEAVAPDSRCSRRTAKAGRASMRRTPQRTATARLPASAKDRRGPQKPGQGLRCNSRVNRSHFPDV